MKHYDLGGTNNSGTPKSLISQEDLKAVKDSFSRVKDNVDKAEALVMMLGLTEFELKILGRRLLNEEF